MKKIKHSKFKNTGILFELLVRQITLEVINGDSVAVAKNILHEFFNKKTELSKELRLYDLLLKEKYKTENRAEKFVDLICEERKKINDKKLTREKYELIKAIKESFSLDKFLSYPLTNYRQLASIYKLFESNTSNTFNIKDKFDAKVTIIEHIIGTPAKNKQKIEESKILKTFSNQDKDLRLLTYKILVENFNKKYTTALSEKQRNLLEQFINNISNTTGFVDYYKGEIAESISKLKSLNKRICDKTTNIKLNETIKLMENIKINKVVSDDNVSMLMLSYELIKEIGDKLNESK